MLSFEAGKVRDSWRPLRFVQAEAHARRADRAEPNRAASETETETAKRRRFHKVESTVAAAMIDRLAQPIVQPTIRF